MRIVVIGGTGLIGSKLVAALNAVGHEAVPAALDTGVNTLTGEGLAEVLECADASMVASAVHVAPVLVEPMAADDVASARRWVAEGDPLNATLEIAGPERFRFDDFIRRAWPHAATHGWFLLTRTRAISARNSTRTHLFRAQVRS